MRLLSLFAIVGVTWCTVATADLPIPKNPRWEPIVDEVYLQEVGSKIVTTSPLTAVAVLDGVAYVGDGRGVFRAAGEALEEVGGPRMAVSRLRTINGALYAAGTKGLWQYAGGAWKQLAEGEYVDVAAHRDGVIAATADTVYQLTGDTLAPINTDPSRIPILGLASYSDSIYARHASQLGFIEKGAFNYTDVQENHASLPTGATMRDALGMGSRLLVPTNKGLGDLRGTTWYTITGEQGLSYEDTTCVAEGFADDYWVGTMRGAIRAVNGEFHYFGHDRWLPNEKVNAIACGDNAAYIATDGGLGIVSYEPYTLQKKSAHYKQWINEWGMKRLGFVHELEYDPDTKTYIRFLSDNDVGWACHYLDALCYEYAVTGDPAVREEAVDVFKSVKWSEEVTPIKGFVARAIHAAGEHAHLAETGSAGRPSEWNPTEDGKWIWKGDTSSDEVASQFYTMHIFYELVAKGTPEETPLKEHLQLLMDHIIDNGWHLADLDGKPTVWARWEPEFVYAREHTDERGLNSAQALAMIAMCQAILGGEKYDAAEQQLKDWGYVDNVLRIKITFPRYTHFDDRLAFLGYYPLLNYETDPELRSIYMRSLARQWEMKRFENQTWFNFIYGALTGNDCQNPAAVQHLRDYPLDCTNYRFTNSHRHDLAVPEGYRNYVGQTKAMGPREQGIRRWDRDPLDLDGGGNYWILDPSSYLDAYWMGRYYGFIKAPTTTDPKLLTAEKSDVQRGVPPYDGTPRPEIF